MKIAITIELDEKSIELFQVPFKKLSKQINDLIGMFEKVDYTVEDTPDIQPKHDLESKKNLKTKTVASNSATQKAKKKSKPQKSVKATILKTIKKNKDGKYSGW